MTLLKWFVVLLVLSLSTIVLAAEQRSEDNWCSGKFVDLNDYVYAVSDTIAKDCQSLPAFEDPCLKRAKKIFSEITSAWANSIADRCDTQKAFDACSEGCMSYFGLNCYNYCGPLLKIKK